MSNRFEYPPLVIEINLGFSYEIPNCGTKHRELIHAQWIRDIHLCVLYSVSYDQCLFSID